MDNIRFSFKNHRKITDSTRTEVSFHFDELNRLVPKEDEFYTVFFLNEDSLAESCEAYVLGKLNDKRYFTYTPNGYLATIRDSTKSAIVNHTLFYTDGNLTNFETKYANIHATNTIEYYPEELKFWTYLQGTYFVGNSVYYPWLGKPSKSLPKSGNAIRQ